MKREDYLKNKISEKNKTQKSVAADLGIPYSTLRDMLNNVGSARVDNVITLCKYLNVPVDMLNLHHNISEETALDFPISPKEKKVVTAYRDTDKITRQHVDLLLGIKEDKETEDEEAKAKKTG